MAVGELIKRLRKLDPELTVAIPYYTTHYQNEDHPLFGVADPRPRLFRFVRTTNLLTICLGG